MQQDRALSGKFDRKEWLAGKLASDPDYINRICKRWRERNPKGVLLKSARARAKQRGWECTITEQDLDIPEHCPILGIPLVIGGGKQHDNSPTVDRADTSKGYIPGNVGVISWRANRLKSDATVDELRSILAYMEAPIR